MKKVDKETLNYKPSKYSIALKLYLKHKAKLIDPLLKCISSTCALGPKYPIFKVLKAISRVFLLNEIEAIHFAYLINESNW